MLVSKNPLFKVSVLNNSETEFYLFACLFFFINQEYARGGGSAENPNYKIFLNPPLSATNYCFFFV